jgi:hypothetical protein
MKKLLTYLQVVAFGLGFIGLQKCNTNKKDGPSISNKTYDISKETAYRKFIEMIEDDSVFIESPTEEDGYFLYPKVSIADNVLFRDTSAIFYYLEKEIFSVEFDNTKYLIFSTANPPDNDEFLILAVRGKELVGAHNVPIGYLADIDGDGITEIGGFRLIEAYCIACDSGYYNPPIIYELGESFRQDPEATKTICEDIYGTFLGLEKRDTVLRVKKI